MKKYFIAGTDTGAGKTYCLSLLIKKALKFKKKVSVMKPFETGCSVVNGKLFPEDAFLLSKILGKEDELDKICPYRFKFPLAPYVAAKLEKKQIDLNVVKAIFNEITINSDVAFVEGAGGLFVPIKDNFMMIDMPKFLGLDIILVSRLGLGAINHTLLCIEALKKRRISIAGIILCDTDKSKDISKKSNPKIIEKFSHLPILSVISHNAKNISLASDTVLF